MLVIINRTTVHGGGDAMKAKAKEQTPGHQVLEELRTAADQAQQGDQRAQARLREILNERPGIVGLYGNLGKLAEQTWIDAIAGSDLRLHEPLVRYVEALRDDLAGPSPNPIERLLVNRIVACWLQLQYFDITEGQDIGDGKSPSLTTFLNHRQSQAHRHFLSAIGALTTVRRLLPVPVHTVPQLEHRNEDQEGGQTVNEHEAAPVDSDHRARILPRTKASDSDKKKHSSKQKKA
jgi:hypothetical protein